MLALQTRFGMTNSGDSVRARDLVCEPFKGGQDAASICLRIAAGMPGNPHPSSSAASQQDIVDLVQFCLSLSREPKQVLTDHQRAVLATGGAYLASLSGRTDIGSPDRQEVRDAP